MWQNRFSRSHNKHTVGSSDYLAPTPFVTFGPKVPRYPNALFPKEYFCREVKRVYYSFSTFASIFSHVGHQLFFIRWYHIKVYTFQIIFLDYNLKTYFYRWIEKINARKEWDKNRWNTKEVEAGVRMKREGSAKGIVFNGAFPRYHSLSFSCNGVAAGRSQPWRTWTRAWRWDVRRTVIYAMTKKYDNRRCQRRFGLIGDRLSMLVTRYRAQVERLSFTLHYPRPESLSTLRGLFSGSV